MLDLARRVFPQLLVTVVLAAISLHAAVPAKAMERSRGSAFSAATVDVALLANSRPAEKAITVQPEPTGPPHDGIVAVALCSKAGAPAQSHLPVWPRAPPLQPIRAQSAQPRAPPTN